MRLYFVLPCILSLTEFVRLYFVLRPQVFQLVFRQLLTEVVRLFFAVQLLVIQPLFSLPLGFIRRRSHPRVNSLNETIMAEKS